MADDPSPPGGKARRRRLQAGIAIASALAVALAVQDPATRGDDAVAQPVIRHPAPASSAPGHAGHAGADRQGAALARLAEELARPSRRGPFPPLLPAGGHAWGVRAPVPALPASAPASSAAAEAVAPEAPFRWVGRWEPAAAGGAAPPPPPMAILSNDTRTWVVKRGDIVSIDWKIERLDADGLELLYLPTSTRRTLALNTP